MNLAMLCTIHEFRNYRGINVKDESYIGMKKLLRLTSVSGCLVHSYLHDMSKSQQRSFRHSAFYYALCPLL